MSHVDGNAAFVDGAAALHVDAPPPVLVLLPLPRRGAPPNARAQKSLPNLLPVVVTSFSRFLQPSGN
jgi:hypothetical protein